MPHDEIRKPNAETIDDEMVRQMEQRRQQHPERRKRQGGTTAAATERKERRVICSFCFQPGDHRTPAQCLRALGG